jgi:hypothetical protein
MAERAFKMHPKLLLDVIKKQAGTIQKAVLEGVMNSIEAGATKVDVAIGVRQVAIKDDGRGFRNAAEVENWFETFGQPHEESEGKKWAQFRMGRGQMFAFGKNTWKTGEFVMLVDIESWAKNQTTLGYDLESGKTPVKGCMIDITLYEPLNDREISNIAREIETYVKYVDIPVHVNGKQVNLRPRDEKWGAESFEQAYVRFNDGARGLDVYNLGVFVRRYSQAEFGVSGIVVSKERLDVNFARNDVIKSCKVWKAIRDRIDKSERVAKVKRKTTLNDEERLNLIDKLGAGELTQKEACNAKLLVDASGHPWSARSISGSGFLTWTIAPANDRRADKLLQRKTCLALDGDVVKEFRCKPHELFIHVWEEPENNHNWRREFTLIGHGRKINFVPFAEAVKDIDGKCLTVHESQWTPNERVWIRIGDVLQHEVRCALDTRGTWDWSKRRKLTIGDSDVANGWTDGVNYIAISRQFLKRLNFERFERPDVHGLTEVCRLLIHELCHEENSADIADHGHEFYKMFHDVCQKAMAKSLHRICLYLTPKKIADLKEKEKKEQVRLAKRVKKEEPKVAKPARVAANRPRLAKVASASGTAPTAAMLHPDALQKIFKAREKGSTWSAIEEEFGLKPANGMTAVHAYNRYKKGR